MRLPVIAVYRVKLEMGATKRRLAGKPGIGDDEDERQDEKKQPAELAQSHPERGSQPCAGT